MPELTDHAGLAAGDRDSLARLVATHSTLEAVLAWSRTASPPRRITEIITQDEFTHDVVLPFEASLYLVYDTT